MTDIFLNDKNNCNLDESACKNKPNARMTADALLHKDVLNQVLAKDRHYIKQKQQDIKKQLKMNFDDKAHQKSLTHLAQIIDRSQKAVNKRREDIPKDLANKLNQDLPVTAAADVLIDAIKRHQVIIVAGETGSGKTTQLPKLAMMAGRGITGQIGHTQPRRLAARSVANRIADELFEPLGQTVSFKVRFSETGSASSIVKLMTDGILLAELAQDKFLSRYDTIIIDEAHERSLNIDFILGYLKQLLPKRPDLKVIITSATLDTDRFAEYFAVNGTPAPVFTVEGRSFPVEIRYRPLTQMAVSGTEDDNFDEMVDNLPHALICAVNECFEDASLRGHPNLADILVFAATESEIRELSDVLSAQNFAHTEILTLFARQSYAEQARIFAPSGRRRIILSTNVAETALTVPNIRYVIDLGFARISRYNYRSRIQRLPIEAISQAAANQRTGRCGRVADGVCIRLYSKEDFHARPLFTEPEILRTNLANVILQMANLKLGMPDDFDFITPPDSRLVNDGAKLLFELGAISAPPTKTAQKKSRKTPIMLTKIGQTMAKMPIDPRLSRMLIAAQEFDCVADMLIIVSALAVQDVRERPYGKEAQADQKHALFKKTGEQTSDFLFYLQLFYALFDKHEANNFEKLSGNARKSFAKKHFLSFVRIREWQKTHSQFSELVRALGFCTDTSAQSGAVSNDKALNEKVLNEKVMNDESIAKTHGATHKASNKRTQKAPTDTTNEAKQNQIHQINIHRALLTALLSFVANKTDVKGEYLMTKSQKARIFPASILHKKGTEWLMAFEVVETSQVYMRTLAKIEPEWILAAAPHLLKYHYFEPHWSKKTGRIKAYAQISLFGLVIVNKLLVNYEQIDLVQSREIFIKDALVLNNYPKPMDFLQHNAKKLEEISRIEDKLRRRDLLVDEEALYQFYDNKLPTHIASAKAFEDWYSDVQTTQPQLLYFSEEDVLNERAAAGREFPEFWQLGGLKLPLSYVFDPSSEDDGVSVKIPVNALSQLDPVALLWGVAGWRFDLVVQLLKSLPKDKRRHIVPIPDTAQKIYSKLSQALEFGLLDQLSKQLATLGVMVSAQEFDVKQVDNYLKPLVCVIDDKGRVIDKDRDIERLNLKYKDKNSTAVHITTGLHTDFPQHFHFVESRHIKGVVIQEFMALKADKAGSAVSIAHYNDLSLAMKTHKKGVLSLIALALGAKQKQLIGQIDKAFKLAFAPLGDLEVLKNMVVFATLTMAFDGAAFDFDMNNDSATNKIREQLAGRLGDAEANLLNHLPLSRLEFEQVQAVVLSDFLSVGQTVLKQMKEIFTTWQTIRGQLLMLDRAIFDENIEDIEDQLDDLSLSDFVYKVPSHIWQDYPRYLSALKIRLDKLPYNVEADTEALYLLDEHMEKIARIGFDDKYQEYRWAVEEYRINLFAQPMKTRYPISDKRLQKIWEKLSTQ